MQHRADHMNETLPLEQLTAKFKEQVQAISKENELLRKEFETLSKKLTANSQLEKLTALQNRFSNLERRTQVYLDGDDGSNDQN